MRQGPPTAHESFRPQHAASEARSFFRFAKAAQKMRRRARNAHGGREEEEEAGSAHALINGKGKRQHL